MRIYNSLSKKIEEFKPINPKEVKMYTCGPTVYDYMHIGNIRTFLLSDTLIRVLSYNNFQVKAVENITDIDDKIIKKAKENNISIEKISQKYTSAFLKDLEELNIGTHTLTELPKATDYVKKMIQFIQELVRNGNAYVEEDGSVYFDISIFPDYGKLSNIEKRELKSGTRTLSDQYEKEDVQDFALWKSVKEGELGFESPWGRGRPGWHIECSVMSQELLGESFDIHVGGIDLLFPHHENEIAQSEAKTGKKFVNYWVHGAHILVDGKKMSKSLKNFYTLADLKEKGFSPLALRYLYLQSHYRQETNFTFEALEGAQNALNKLYKEMSQWVESKDEIKEFKEKFLEAINDDLNMPRAMAVVWETVKSNYDTSEKAATLLKFDRVLGLKFNRAGEFVKKVKRFKIPEKVKEMVEEREKLRQERRYDSADELRDKIRKQGYDIQDRENGVEVIKLDKV